MLERPRWELVSRRSCASVTPHVRGQCAHVRQGEGADGWLSGGAGASHPPGSACRTRRATPPPRRSGAGKLVIDEWGGWAAAHRRRRLVGAAGVGGGDDTCGSAVCGCAALWSARESGKTRPFRNGARTASQSTNPDATSSCERERMTVASQARPVSWAGWSMQS